MRNKIERIFLYLSAFLLVWNIVHITTYYFIPGFAFNYQFWTPLPAGVFLLALFGLTSFIYLMLNSHDQVLRAFYIVIACFGFIFFSVITLWESEDVETRVDDGYILHISKFRFLFSGHDDIYIEDNFFWSHKVASAEQDEDYWSTYYIEEDVLIIKTCWYSGDEYYKEVDLTESE